MKLFGKRREPVPTLEALLRTPYRQQYFDQCREVWKRFVPQRGSSDALQGELLRVIEKLRCEAQDNGNINWCEDHSYFCTFLKTALGSQTCLTETERTQIGIITDFLRKQGESAERFFASEDPSESGCPVYTEDTLYDILADAVGKLYAAHPEPIPYAHTTAICH